MKKWWSATPLMLALLLVLVTAVPSDAWRGAHGHHWHGGSRVFVGFGFGPWWGYPYWYYPPPYYVYAPPTVVVQQPPVYVEQQPAAPAPPASAAPQQYWYYCQPSGAYYPNVQTCTDPWVKVPARSQ
jgi:hypothetical protein